VNDDFSNDDPQDRTELFVSLLGRAQSHVHAHILTLLPHWADAEDILQRTNIILWRKFAEWRPEQDFNLWACGIARFEVKNFLRVRSRDRLCFGDDLLESLGLAAIAVTERLDVGAHTEALRECLRRLRSIDRQIIDGCYGEESVSAKEVAQRLGRPANTVYKALIRIRRTLFVCIRQALAEEEGS
jgi:RNA polymerase sigma-70 factor (ECF subfamily)